jgi:cell division protein FtsB
MATKATSMPPARSARAPRTAPAPQSARAPRTAPGPRPRARAIRGARRGARGIRWDRVSRVALLIVLLGILALYVGPARSYWSTVQEAKHRRAEVAALKRVNDRLRARRAALRNPAALEREARRLGMVRPGERPYVVKHLPKGP